MSSSNQLRLELINTHGSNKCISIRSKYKEFRSSHLPCRHHFVPPNLYVALNAKSVRFHAHVRIRTGVRAVVVFP